VRNTTSPAGIRFFNKVSTPIEKAMSVAIGIAQPVASTPERLNARYTPAGTTIPPTAATSGSMAREKELSSPSTSSRLISSPTTRKKIAIRPSLIRWWRVNAPRQPSISTASLRWRRCWYDSL
jgi:hypothetical protein